MTRSKQREQAFILVYESLFGLEESSVELYEENVEPVGAYARQIYVGVAEKQEQLDAVIAQYASGWKLARIAKVNVAILRLALYEIVFVDEVPPSVAINEAVELAKKYSGKEAASFINGILGAYMRET